MSIEVSTRRYESAHGKRPRGQGYWAFCPEQHYDAMNYLDFCVTFTGTYVEAKKAAVAHFKNDARVDVIVVCS